MARSYNFASSALRSHGESAQLRPISHEFRQVPRSALASVEPLADTERSLRERAAAADRFATDELSLALLWRELGLGLTRVVDCFFTSERCLLLSAPRPGPPRPLSPQRREVLEAVLVCGAQKVVAIELGLAPSTVASNAQQALETLGVLGRPSRPHPLLVLAAKAERSGDTNALGSLSFFEQGAAELRVVSVLRPELALINRFSRAEFAVLQGLVEGEPYATMARRRGTSERTVANQIASVFRGLRVSGRAEFLLRLFASRG